MELDIFYTIPMIMSLTTKFRLHNLGAMYLCLNCNWYDWQGWLHWKQNLHLELLLIPLPILYWVCSVIMCAHVCVSVLQLAQY